MKRCRSCGELNWKPDKKCGHCDKPLDDKGDQFSTEHRHDSSGLKGKSRLHDEYPWSDTDGR